MRTGEPMRRILGRTFINPAAGPCTPDESGPMCDRDAVLEEIEPKCGSRRSRRFASQQLPHAAPPRPPAG